MSASAGIADFPLRQACTWIPGLLAGGLTAQSVDILFKDASLPRSSTRPSRFGDHAISLRTVMNNKMWASGMSPLKVVLPHPFQSS
jgi:hypothetical protein